MIRRAHFRVASLSRRFNGATAAKVTIVSDGNHHQVVLVRPHKRRKVYDATLEDVAALVIDRAVKRDIAEKRKAKGR